MKKAKLDGWTIKPYDDDFKILISSILKKISKDDDYLLMCVGDTGCGKSVLTLHAYEIVDPDNCSINNISFCPEDHASAMQALMSKEGIRFIANDEANIQKRNSTTKYNKDLIDLYFSIRGLNFFHWWNNPSLDIIDKVFIKEKINGVIYIFNKETKYPRGYVFFSKEAMLKIIDKYKTITLDILKKNKGKYATYQGWFRDYKGKLREPYSKKKKERMENKVNDFFTKYGGDLLKPNDVAKELHITTQCVRDRTTKLIEREELIEGEDYTISSQTGHRLYTENGAEKIKNYGLY
jgi:energy-coupling factor transporter ATP-binding protein EcfA2